MSALDDLGGIADDTGFKAPCRVATTANLGTALIGLLVVDNVQLVIGDRVLVWQQTDQATNGIYVVSSGAWSRAIDFSSSSSIMRGTQVFVTDGTLYGGSAFYCQTTNPSIGTTPIGFSQPSTITPAYLNSLPISDPQVLGRPWNDGGIFAISKGP